jgi:transposase-like protein
MRFEKSGLSGAEFCRRQGVHLTTFSNWRRLARTEGRASLDRPTFARVCVTTPVSAASRSVVIELPNAMRLEVPQGTDPEWISTLVGTLSGS